LERSIPRRKARGKSGVGKRLYREVIGHIGVVSGLKGKWAGEYFKLSKNSSPLNAHGFRSLLIQDTLQALFFHNRIKKPVVCIKPEKEADKKSSPQAIPRKIWGISKEEKNQFHQQEKEEDSAVNPAVCLQGDYLAAVGALIIKDCLLVAPAPVKGADGLHFLIAAFATPSLVLGEWGR
jgi:hypothetical protein